jgi:hypothetical protein
LGRRGDWLRSETKFALAVGWCRWNSEPRLIAEQYENPKNHIWHTRFDFRPRPRGRDLHRHYWTPPLSGRSGSFAIRGSHPRHLSWWHHRRVVLSISEAESVKALNSGLKVEANRTRTISSRPFGWMPFAPCFGGLGGDGFTFSPVPLPISGPEFCRLRWPANNLS